MEEGRETDAGAEAWDEASGRVLLRMRLRLGLNLDLERVRAVVLGASLCCTCRRTLLLALEEACLGRPELLERKLVSNWAFAADSAYAEVVEGEEAGLDEAGDCWYERSCCW